MLSSALDLGKKFAGASTGEMRCYRHQDKSAYESMTGRGGDLISCTTMELVSDEWYSAMADMHLIQLTFQHNNAVDGEGDARDKYVARQLFRKLASDGRLAYRFNPQAGEGREPTFRLFSEDLRPSNILIDKDLRVVGVIDWEFAYAAPAKFFFDPPWWVLLKYPEYWPGGYGDWMEAYESRFRTFISVQEEEEK